MLFWLNLANYKLAIQKVNQAQTKNSFDVNKE
jgi:hypothetical protein